MDHANSTYNARLEVHSVMRSTGIRNLSRYFFATALRHDVRGASTRLVIPTHYLAAIFQLILKRVYLIADEDRVVTRLPGPFP